MPLLVEEPKLSPVDINGTEQIFFSPEQTCEEKGIRQVAQ